MVTAAQSHVSDTRFSTHEMVVSARLQGDFVPKNFTELHQYYWQYVIKEVRKAGIDEQNAEDVAQTLLTIFFEKRVLDDFDPEFTSSHGGVVRKAVFRTFLSGFIRTYVRHYRTKQIKQYTREGVSIDVMIMDAGEPDEDLTWLDLNGPEVYDDHSDLDFEIFTNSVRSHLATLEPRNAQDRCDMTDLFDAIVSQLEISDRLDIAELAQRFEVSKTSIQNWIKRLRAELSVVLDR